jgi:hypothetical protein
MRDDAGIQGVFDQDVAAAPVAAGESQRSGGSHHIGIAYEFVESALVDTPGYDLLSVSAGLLPDMASWAGPRSFGRG